MSKLTEDLLEKEDGKRKPLEIQGNDLVLLVNLNLSRRKKTAIGSCWEDNQYDATRGCWKINKDRAKKVNYVLGVDKDAKTNKNRVCTVIKIDPKNKNRCELVKTDDYGVIFDKGERVRFNGTLDNTHVYFGKDVSRFRFRGNPVRYVSRDTIS